MACKACPSHSPSLLPYVHSRVDESLKRLVYFLYFEGPRVSGRNSLFVRILAVPQLFSIGIEKRAKYASARGPQHLYLQPASKYLYVTFPMRKRAKIILIHNQLQLHWSYATFLFSYISLETFFFGVSNTPYS